MVAIKPCEIKILCMQRHIPSQEKPRALCSGKICICLDTYTFYPFVLEIVCTKRLQLIVFSTAAACQTLQHLGGFRSQRKCKLLMEEDDGSSSSWKKKQWCLKASCWCCKSLPKAPKTSLPV